MSTSKSQRPNNSGRTTLIGLLLIGVLLLAIVILLNLRQSMLAPAPTPTATFAPDIAGITMVEPPFEVQDFTLPASTGEDMSLSSLRGQYVLIFFGYSHCPDVCPTTLTDFRLIKEALGADARRVAFVFTSVDGQRDTPEALNAYVSRFDPTFIGLQGNDATLEQIAPDYGLSYVLHTDEADADGNYVVDHTTYRYLIDPQGRLRALISTGATDDDIVSVIESMIATENDNT